jgi:hypothetical protein
MAQVGHGDSKVTLEICAQVLKRRDREQIGRAFDHLLVGGGRGEPRTAARATRRPISRSKTARDEAAILAETGQSEPRSGQHRRIAVMHIRHSLPSNEETPTFAGVLRVELAGLEPATSCMPCRPLAPPILACLQGILFLQRSGWRRRVSRNFRAFSTGLGQRPQSLAQSSTLTGLEDVYCVCPPPHCSTAAFALIRIVRVRSRSFDARLQGFGAAGGAIAMISSRATATPRQR